MEATYRDYQPKGVKFYFIYKTLAHPELTGGYVQPFTLEERLAHAKQAEKQLGATIPWLVDAMDNRLKHALGNRPNSEFIVDPEGRIVRKRAWSNPAQVRLDLQELVGKVENPTKESDLQLNMQIPLAPPVERGLTERIKRPRMQPIVATPMIDEKQPIFYAKLRAEIEPNAFDSGQGKMYLGFFLDPFHAAHWNNLTDPLSYKIELPASVEIPKAAGTAKSVTFASDVDPREFIIDIKKWPKGETLLLTVNYAACVGANCNLMQQQYKLELVPDQEAGSAKGKGAGFWVPLEFAQRLMNGDKDGNGTLSKGEVMGLVVPHFDSFDTNHDGELTLEESKTIADWLNFRHAPKVKFEERHGQNEKQ